MYKPQGKLTVTGFSQSEPHEKGVWATIFVTDEAGNQFSYLAAEFSYEVKPHPVGLSIDYSEWVHKLMILESSNKSRWRYKEPTDEQREAYYMAGLTPEQALAKGHDEG